MCPIRFVPSSAVGVNATDGCLELRRANSPLWQRLTQQRIAFVNLRTGPALAVLLVKRDQITLSVPPAMAARIVQKHERQKAHNLRLIWQQLAHDAG